MERSKPEHFTLRGEVGLNYGKNLAACILQIEVAPFRLLRGRQVTSRC